MSSKISSPQYLLLSEKVKDSISLHCPPDLLPTRLAILRRRDSSLGCRLTSSSALTPPPAGAHAPAPRAPSPDRAGLPTRQAGIEQPLQQRGRVGIAIVLRRQVAVTGRILPRLQPQRAALAVVARECCGFEPGIFRQHLRDLIGPVHPRQFKCAFSASRSIVESSSSASGVIAADPSHRRPDGDRSNSAGCSAWSCGRCESVTVAPAGAGSKAAPHYAPRCCERPARATASSR